MPRNCSWSIIYSTYIPPIIIVNQWAPRHARSSATLECDFLLIKFFLYNSLRYCKAVMWDFSRIWEGYNLIIMWGVDLVVVFVAELHGIPQDEEISLCNFMEVSFLSSIVVSSLNKIRRLLHHLA